MANNTSIKKRTVMQRAWKIFKKQYNYPSIQFKSIGRKCFAWALKVAWQQLKKEATIQKMSKVEIDRRVAALKNAIAMLPYASLRYDIASEENRINAEIQTLTQAA